MGCCDATLAPEGPAEKAVDPEQLLIEELSRVRDDRALVFQIARLVQLSRQLRSRCYTGQVTLHMGNGVVNSVRQEEWVNWRPTPLGGR